MALENRAITDEEIEFSDDGDSSSNESTDNDDDFDERNEVNMFARTF